MKSSKSPGEIGFVRKPLSDRVYDLSPLDPKKPCIHALVDDVLMKILNYLPLRKRFACEVVCRRWQRLLYVTLEATTHFNVDSSFIKENCSNCCIICLVSKLLLLKGITLKSLFIYGQRTCRPAGAWREDVLWWLADSWFATRQRTVVHPA